MLTGRLALVTGAGQGIGAAVAAGLAGLGARVVIADIQPALAASTAKTIETAGGTAWPLEMDVADSRSCDRGADWVNEKLGPLSILVNNAAILRQGKVDAPDFRQNWDEVVKVNLNGTLNPIMSFLPQLRQTKGSVINTGSIAAYFSLSTFAGYGAAKAGVLALTRSLAHELAADGIRVNAVVPGAFRTPMTVYMDPARRDFYLNTIALKRFGEPNEMTGPIAFLASDLASYVTGVALPVDGGFSIT